MLETSLDNGDYPNKHELGMQAKDAFVKAIFRLYPDFKETVIDLSPNLSDHIGMMRVRVTDQSGVAVVHSFNVERVRCELNIDFMRSHGLQEGGKPDYGNNKCAQWTELKSSIVFSTLQVLPTKLRIILGQDLISESDLEESSQLLDDKNMAHLIPPVTEALRNMYIRITGSSIGFGE